MKNTIEERLISIEKRNKRVELDKMWETSIERRLLISLLTYVLVSMFFLYSKVEKPFLNAIVPTLGFIISTLTLNLFKKYWLKRKVN